MAEARIGQTTPYLFLACHSAVHLCEVDHLADVLHDQRAAPDVLLGAQAPAHLELPEGLRLRVLALLDRAVRAARAQCADAGAVALAAAAAALHVAALDAQDAVEAVLVAHSGALASHLGHEARRVGAVVGGHELVVVLADHLEGQRLLVVALLDVAGQLEVRGERVLGVGRLVGDRQLLPEQRELVVHLPARDLRGRQVQRGVQGADQAAAVKATAGDHTVHVQGARAVDALHQIHGVLRAVELEAVEACVEWALEVPHTLGRDLAVQVVVRGQKSGVVWRLCCPCSLCENKQKILTYLPRSKNIEQKSGHLRCGLVTAWHMLSKVYKLVSPGCCFASPPLLLLLLLLLLLPSPLPAEGLPAPFRAL